MADLQRYQLLASVIAAHPSGKVVGRTRLQKTVKLLQRLGLQTNYAYTNHFYGPYSEDLQADVHLLGVMGSVKETPKASAEGTPYYVIEAKESESLPDEYRPIVERLARQDPVVLELAATYDSFIEMGVTRDRARELLRLKKGEKCAGGNEERALDLLQQLDLLPS